MFLRKIKSKDKIYWALVETIRTERGPRQRIVSYLGDINEQVCKGVEAPADDSPKVFQGALFDEAKICPAPRWHGGLYSLPKRCTVRNLEERFFRI